jgi:hypothetical protein
MNLRTELKTMLKKERKNLRNMIRPREPTT